MENFTDRNEVIATALAMNSSGLNQGTSGNISVRHQGGFLITPSALKYEECTPEDIVAVEMSGNYEGRRKPSSEWRMHRDVYQKRPDAGAVLHAHPVWSTTLACLNKPIPPFHYMVAIAGGGSIPIAPYALFGTQELSDNLLHTLKESRACLLAHHGLICYASDLAGVLDLGIEIEALAKMYVQALQVGEPPLLSSLEMSAVLDRFGEYKP